MITAFYIWLYFMEEYEYSIILEYQGHFCDYQMCLN